MSWLLVIVTLFLLSVGKEAKTSEQLLDSFLENQDGKINLGQQCGRRRHIKENTCGDDVDDATPHLKYNICTQNTTRESESQAVESLSSVGIVLPTSAAALDVPEAIQDFPFFPPFRTRLRATHGWDHCVLTWTVLSAPIGRSGDEIREIFSYVLSQWEQAVNFGRSRPALVFQEVYPDEPADLKLAFVQQDHKDGYPFDGKGGKFAHTFLPDSSPRKRGQIHFDADDDWRPSVYPGNSFVHMLLHETGHALGLNHTWSRDSIMYPFISTTYTSNVLYDKDIQLIQRLYAADCRSKNSVRARLRNEVLEPTQFSSSRRPHLAPPIGLNNRAANFRPPSRAASSSGRNVFQPSLSQPGRPGSSQDGQCFKQKCGIFGPCTFVPYPCDYNYHNPRGFLTIYDF